MIKRLTRYECSTIVSTIYISFIVYCFYCILFFSKNNTFQCVLATNGKTSYAIFLYPEDGINWYSGDASGGTGGINGAPAQVGLNKGDGIVFHTASVSSTPNVINVDESTNIDGGPSGFYIWNVNNATSGSSCSNEGEKSTIRLLLLFYSIYIS